MQRAQTLLRAEYYPHIEDEKRILPRALAAIFPYLTQVGQSRAIVAMSAFGRSYRGSKAALESLAKFDTPAAFDALCQLHHMWVGETHGPQPANAMIHMQRCRPQVIAAMQAEAGAEDPQRRALACSVLGRIAPSVAESVLVAALHSADESVRAAAAFSVLANYLNGVDARLSR